MMIACYGDGYAYAGCCCVVVVVVIVVVIDCFVLFAIFSLFCFALVPLLLSLTLLGNTCYCSVILLCLSICYSY